MIGLLQDQRRAQRLPIYLPVQVYGKLDGVPFSEATETINVSACGGLVPISAAARRHPDLGDSLRIEAALMFPASSGIQFTELGAAAYL